MGGEEAVFLGNLDKKDTKNHFQTSDIFVERNTADLGRGKFNNNIFSLRHYKTQRLWNNSLIRIDRKPVYFREWVAKGILAVKSLIKEETCFLSYTEFLNKSCPLAFSGINATFKTIRKRFKENTDSLETFEVESFTKAFQKTKKPAIYKRIEISLQQRVKNREHPKQNGTEIATLMRKKWTGKKHFSSQEHAQKVPKLFFSNLNFSIDVCLQTPFCIRLLLKIMIFAPFARKKQTLCFTFSGNAK